MILDKYNVISIDIPRTASSARARLFANVDIDYGYVPEHEVGVSVKEMRKKYWSRIDKHAPARQYFISSPVRFMCYYKYSFVRNPWDRMVSYFGYRSRKFGISDFEEYIIENPFGDLDRNQMDYLIGPFGRIIVNFVGRYERLYEDFQRLAEKIGYDNQLDVFQDKIQSTKYRSYYSQNTKEIVRASFQRDILEFGYSF